jgi:hypothetical protein
MEHKGCSWLLPSIREDVVTIRNFSIKVTLIVIRKNMEAYRQLILPAFWLGIYSQHVKRGDGQKNRWKVEEFKRSTKDIPKSLSK